jgi:hypothetical protein
MKNNIAGMLFKVCLSAQRTLPSHVQMASGGEEHSWVVNALSSKGKGWENAVECLKVLFCLIARSIQEVEETTVKIGALDDDDDERTLKASLKRETMELHKRKRLFEKTVDVRAVVCLCLSVADSFEKLGAVRERIAGSNQASTKVDG